MQDLVDILPAFVSAGGQIRGAFDALILGCLLPDPTLVLLLRIGFKALDDGLADIWGQRIFDFKNKAVWLYLIDFVGFYLGILWGLHFLAKQSLYGCSMRGVEYARPVMTGQTGIWGLAGFRPL